MTETKEDILKKIESLTLKTYGPRRIPANKEYMTHEELLAMSPQGANQSTNISKKFAKHREMLPVPLKRALKYLYPSKINTEKPPVSKYDLMVRKMSMLSLTPVVEGSHSPKILRKKLNPLALNKKMSGIFDFPKLEGKQMLERDQKNRSKSTLKIPKIAENRIHARYSSLDYINCISYTGEAESEYLKTFEGQKEYRKLYELTLLESGLYQEIRIRNQNKNRVHYRRMPV